MENAIWGTGYYAGKFSKAFEAEIAFYIDRDKKKNGTLFLGKRVVNPDNITVWNNLRVYIPFNYYEEIAHYLNDKGLTENINYYMYGQTHSISLAKALEDYEKKIREMEEKTVDMKAKYLFWGHVWNGIKGYRSILLPLQKTDPEFELALASEEIWREQRDVEKEAKIPAITVPIIFDQDFYIKKSNSNNKMDKSELQIWYKYIERFDSRFDGKTDSEMMIFLIRKYIETVLKLLCPKAIIMLGSFQISHSILGKICEQNNIPVIYTHEGVLPGTLSFDYNGEMGKSLVALYPQEFRKLYVSEEELKNAEEVWNFLVRNGLNRKVQPARGIDEVKKRIVVGQPTVFFAGQLDVASDMVPYDEDTQTYISPIFKSSIEAGIYLSKICEKNSWNFIYKPHPSFIKREEEKLLSGSTIYVATGNINDIVDISDLTITIVSQTSYIALIRNKPVLMLGYNQICGKDCVYECYNIEQIEATIIEALNKGFSDTQKLAFRKHIAQMIKYYLYDDNREREIRYGKKPPQKFNEFADLKRVLKVE